MIDFTEVDKEILYTNSIITKIDDADVAFLKDRARANKRKRVRLCTHSDIDDSLHEMLIVHSAGNYVPPHKHSGKSESFHIIEGTLKIVLFFDDGNIREIINMSEPQNGDIPFFYRLSESIFHTVITTSEIVVFHETTNGPFRREDKLLAEWAPNDDDPYTVQKQYMEELRSRIEKFQ